MFAQEEESTERKEKNLEAQKRGKKQLRRLFTQRRAQTFTTTLPPRDRDRDRDGEILCVRCREEEEEDNKKAQDLREREKRCARDEKNSECLGKRSNNEQQRYKNEAEKRIRNAVDVYHALGVDFGATHIRAHAHFGESFFETYSVVCVLYAEIGDSVAVLVLLWTDGKTDANERYFLEATLLVRTDGDFFRDRVLTRVRV